MGIFAVAALLLIASGTGASQRTKQTLTLLASALAVGRRKWKITIVDIRKQELLSAVPWINRWLLKVELAPRLRSTLYQANVKWTAGGLLLMSAACFVIPAYLLYLRTGALVFSLLLGLVLGFAPFVLCAAQAPPALQQIRRGIAGGARFDGERFACRP